jgi:hypothetical protein
MPACGDGHLPYVRRYLWPAVVVVGVLLVLGVMLLIGVLRGDDTDIERRQEDPKQSAPLLSLS